MMPGANCLDNTKPILCIEGQCDRWSIPPDGPHRHSCFIDPDSMAFRLEDFAFVELEWILRPGHNP